MADLNGFSELRVALCRFNHFALADQKPSDGVSQLAPIRLQREDFVEEAFGFVRMIASRLELGALEQREQIGTVLLAGACCPGFHFLQDGGALGGDVGDGLIDTFRSREDAGHFIEDVSGPLAALYIGKGSRQFINAGDASGIGLLGGLAKTLAFFPALGLFRFTFR